MTSTLQIVDDAQSVVLFDLNDPTGANNAEWGSVKTEILATADLASPAIRSSQVLYSSADGGTTAFRRAGLTVSEFGMTMEATSYDNLAAGVNRLSTLLALGGVMKWIPQGSAETRYIDFEPSETPALVNGQELGLWEVIQLFAKPHGVTVRVTRQPYLRGPELNSDNNELTNATLCLDRTADLVPDDWAWDSSTNITNGSVTAARECFSFDIATTATRNLQQTTPNSSLTSGNTHTLATYARASVGGVARLEEVWQGLTNAGATQGAEVVSTQTTLTTTWQRVSVSANLAASSTKALVSHRFRNAAATSVRVDLRNAILTQAATAPPFYVGTETMNNDPATGKGNVSYFYNPGSAPAEVSVLLEPAASNDALRMWVAPRGSGTVGQNNVTVYANNRHFYQAEALTMGANTATAAGGANFSGAGNNVAATTFATLNSISQTRVSTTITTNLDALRGGTWAVVARLASSAGGASTFDVGMSWGFDSGGNYYTGPVAYIAGQFFNNVGGEPWVIGLFEVPEGAEQVNFRTHAERMSGADNLWWDTISFLSIEQFALVGSVGGTGPSFGGGASGLRTFPGEPAVRSYSNATPDAPRWTGQVVGAVPFVALPGLSAVHIFTDDAWNADTGSQTLRFRSSPRYYS